VPSRTKQGLQRSPYQEQASGGIDAWLGEPDVGGARDVPDVQDVPHVQAVPDVSRKPVRIAGPKWDPEMLQQARDAVLFLRQRGRPTMALIEALDEAVRAWLREQQAEHNGGEAFPSQGGLR
jgi:hypothetical protein